MFDFLDSDGFIIGLEIVFLTFIVYDAYKYVKTRRKSYLLNIVMAIGFAIWVLYPFYTKYYMWEEKDRAEVLTACLNEHNSSYCSCMDNMIYKTYDLQSFLVLDKNSSDYAEFIKESEEECFESSWF